MSDPKIISLSRARKTRAREEKAALGDANAAKFGRSKAEKQREKLETKNAKDHLDGHKREP